MISKGVKSIFPIKHQDIWDKYKLHIQAFWTPEEVSLHDDLRDLETLNDGEKHFIKHVLAYFANSEAMINENLASRFYKEILIPEARCFISVQMLNESIHAEMYGLQIEAYVKDQQEKDHLFDAIQNVPCINRKAQWVSKWLNGSQNLLTRLIGFGLVEGLFFAGSFCAIYYFRKRGLLPGLALSNDWIARDEGMHTDFAILLYHKLDTRLEESVVHDIFSEAVEIEKEFICDSLKCSLIGMNKDLMSEYIEFVADRLLTQLGYSKLFNTVNPFEFMNQIGMDGKTNFFEQRVTEYQIGGDDTINNFVIDDDF